MKTLVIYAHPWDGSFNNYIKEKTIDLLKKENKEVDLIDLNKDGFDPVMRPEDLKLFSQGKYHDPLAENYVQRLLEADEIVMIFPIWWYGEPAILKGFYDKVFLKGHVYDQVDYQLKGLLKAKNALILTTGNINKEYFNVLGNPIENVTAKATLGLIGIENHTWIHCPTVHLDEARNNFLNEVDNYFKQK